MFWVIQDGLYHENGFAALCSALDRLQVPYTFVKVVPMASKLLPAGFDTNSWHEDISNAPDADIDDSGLVMVCGATAMSKVAKDRGWTPGSFLNDDFRYEKWLENYGENLLNANSVVCRFDQVNRSGEFFIRPCEDSKAFTGMVTDQKSFSEWQHKVVILNEKSSFSTVVPETMVSTSSVKTIMREYRFFVVDGDVVTGSLYKQGDKVLYSSDIEPDVWNYAQQMVNVWQPARAFCIDIALTDKGFRVIEINCINSAGFYALDVMKFVGAIESMSY